MRRTRNLVVLLVGGFLMGACGGVDDPSSVESALTAQVSTAEINTDPAILDRRAVDDSDGLVPQIAGVHKTPGGTCALGSPGNKDIDKDIDKCEDLCGKDNVGTRATSDGSGGCKLQCHCGDGGGWIDHPGITDGIEPASF